MRLRQKIREVRSWGVHRLQPPLGMDLLSILPWGHSGYCVLRLASCFGLIPSLPSPLFFFLPSLLSSEGSLRWFLKHVPSGSCTAVSCESGEQRPVPASPLNRKLVQPAGSVVIREPAERYSDVHGQMN